MQVAVKKADHARPCKYELLPFWRATRLPIMLHAVIPLLCALLYNPVFSGSMSRFVLLHSFLLRQDGLHNRGQFRAHFFVWSEDFREKCKSLSKMNFGGSDKKQQGTSPGLAQLNGDKNCRTSTVSGRTCARVRARARVCVY